MDENKLKAQQLQFINYEDLKRETPITSTSSIPEVNFRKIKFDDEKLWLPWRIVDYNLRIVNFL